MSITGWLPRRGRNKPARGQTVDALVQEMRDLRLVLDVDLTMAAAAVDAEEPTIAGDVIDQDIKLVRDFEQRAREKLAAAIPQQRRWPRRVIATLAVVPTLSVAVAAAAVGIGTVNQRSAPTGSSIAAATESYEQLTRYVSTGASAQKVLAVAAHLNATLQHLVATAATNPAAASAALRLLRLEQQVFLKNSTPGLAVLVQQAEQIVAALKPYMSPAAAAAVQHAQFLLARKAQQQKAAAPEASKSASPKPNPSPTASPSPTPTPTTSSTPSPSPTPAETISPPLPSNGGPSATAP